MWRKTLLTLSLVGLLALPAGFAVAQTDADETGVVGAAEALVTRERLQEHDQDQLRTRGPDSSLDCPRLTAQAGDLDREHLRDRDRVRDPEECGDQLETREAIRERKALHQGEDAPMCNRERVAENEEAGTRERVMEHARVHAEEAPGPQAGPGPAAVGGDGPGPGGGGYGEGVGDGTGPIHEGPADGTGNQYGPGH
jgi:hypothetical protein